MSHELAMLAGYGESDLTPPFGVELAGYGYYLARRAQAVLDSLKARAVYLKYGASSILLICCDLIGFTVAFSDAIRASIAARMGLPVSNILLACTHTHAGPATMPLRAVGAIDPDYLATVSERVQRAALAAVADARPAALASAFPYVEPIGYNRRLRSFEPIDPVLNVALLQRREGSIVLTSYACHAVTLGRVNQVSADWPGGVVRAFERRGYHALAFQGYCGDIDPVVFMNQWGSGTPEDLELMGELLCQRALKALASAKTNPTPELVTGEERIRLPLDVPESQQALDEELAGYLARDPAAGAERMIRSWHVDASAERAELYARPYLEAPVLGWSLGNVRLVGLPGEVFAEYSTRLRGTWPTLFPVGYAGGVVGYVPTAETYDRADDYAAYDAPRLYQLFPFERDVERVMLGACEQVLHSLERSASASTRGDGRPVG